VEPELGVDTVSTVMPRSLVRPYVGRFFDEDEDEGEEAEALGWAATRLREILLPMASESLGACVLIFGPFARCWGGLSGASGELGFAVCETKPSERGGWVLESAAAVCVVDNDEGRVRPWLLPMRLVRLWLEDDAEEAALESVGFGETGDLAVLVFGCELLLP
jgi:hypothetical protein